MSVGYQPTSVRKDVVGTFCSEAIEKFLSDLFRLDTARGVYVSSYNPEVTLEADDAQQIVWISGVNTPFNAFDVVRTYRFGELDKSIKE